MARTLIAGNWKMHGLRAQIAEIGAEDCSADEAGPFTGDIDANVSAGRVA